MRNNVLLLLVLHVVSLNAQFFDSFNDGDFVANPKWLGNTSLFTVDPQNKLRLNAPAGGLAYLYTPLSYPDSFITQFELQMEFNPSASNHTRVYFMAASTNPHEGRSYLIKAGENGSSDAIRLYRSDNDQLTLLASGSEGALSVDPSMARVKIEYRPGGRFTCFADYDYNGSYEEVFSAIDPLFLPFTPSYFGVECIFTASRKDKFVFDNLGVSALIGDRTPPEIILASVKNEKQIEIRFNEPLSDETALQPLHYWLENGLHPDYVDFLGTEDRVLLNFNNSLPDVDTLQLTVSGVADQAGNVLDSSRWVLNYTRPPLPGELVLSEILFDPYVNHDDFVEVFNAGNKAVIPDSLRFVNALNGQSVFVTDKKPLLPGRYRAYTRDVGQLMSTYQVDSSAEVMQQNLPAFNNDKGRVLLYSSSGMLLDSLSYTPQLHTLNPEEKEAEGVSLEKVQLIPFYNAHSNWISASKKTLYASPGYANAVSLDTTPPLLEGTEAPSPHQLLVYFDDFILFGSAVAAQNIRIYDNEQNELSATVISSERKTISIELTVPLRASGNYTLRLTGLRDKNKNVIRDTFTSFMFGNAPEKGDLVLSEVLFYPESGVADFLEFYNASAENIQLRGLSISNRDNGQEQTLDSYFVLAPGKHVAISEDTSILKKTYAVPGHALFIQNDLPALNADEGLIEVYNDGSTLLDSFSYHEDRHHILIDKEDRKGVSLEKIALRPFDNSAFNWASSSQSGGFASPGYQNSNYFVTGDARGIMDLPKKVFSPNQDGHDDLLILEYALAKPGFVAQLAVYSAEGYKVKNLTNNELLGQTGIITWDGTNEDGLPEILGIYIIAGTLFHPDGEVIKVKKDCVLADFID